MACGRSTRRVATQTSTTAEATAERKCMTLPLACIFCVGMLNERRRAERRSRAIQSDSESSRAEPSRAESIVFYSSDSNIRESAQRMLRLTRKIKRSDLSLSTCAETSKGGEIVTGRI